MGMGAMRRPSCCRSVIIWLAGPAQRSGEGDGEGGGRKSYCKSRPATSARDSETTIMAICRASDDDLRVSDCLSDCLLVGPPGPPEQQRLLISLSHLFLLLSLFHSFLSPRLPLIAQKMCIWPGTATLCWATLSADSVLGQHRVDSVSLHAFSFAQCRIRKEMTR